MYEYAHGRPLYYLDVLGTDTVAVYDGDDRRTDSYGVPIEGVSDGSDFQSGAADYDHAFDVTDAADAAEKLTELTEDGVEIDELHTFDHGSEGTQELGDAHLGSNEDDWIAMAKNVAPGGCVYLHGCRVGGTNSYWSGPNYLQMLATMAGVTVQGWTGDSKYLLGWHWMTGEPVVKPPTSKMPRRQPRKPKTPKKPKDPTATQVPRIRTNDNKPEGNC